MIRTIRKIFFWFLAPVILLAGIVSAIGYFYYAGIIRDYVTATVEKESKGLYHAEIGKVYLNIIAGDMTLGSLSLVPDTALYRTRAPVDTLSPLLIGLRIKQVSVGGFQAVNALLHRNLMVSRIRFDKPEVTVFRMRMPSGAGEAEKKEMIMSVPLPPSLVSIGIKEFAIDNAEVELVDCTGDSITRMSFPACNVLVKNILVDSAHRGQKRLFNADDISVDLGSYSMRSKNGMNNISFGGIGLSTGTGEAYIRNFHLEPIYSKHDYSRKLGYQTDRMDIRISSVRLRRVNLRKLLFEGRLQAGLLEVDSLILDDYRDKRVQRRPGFRPPMPQDGIRSLKTYVRIDSVLLKNGMASYAEQTGEVPGTIFFDRMSALFTGLTNDSALLAAGLVSELKGTAYLMGKGKLDANIRFNFGNRQNSFTFSATLGPFDLAEINPMLSNLLPAKVVSGRLNKLVLPVVFANDDAAQGKIQFYYSDLSVSVLDTKHTTWSKIKTGVINFAANDLIINKDNPSRSGKVKTGIVYFKRDKEKGIINFLWKSTLSGLKSTMGFNSEAQKAMLRHENQGAEEKRKQEKKKRK